MNNDENLTGNKKLAGEIAIILVIKLILLMVIKLIWFSAPTVPNDTMRVAEHIAGQSSIQQESL